MHFKTINYDVTALEWVFKTFFFHVVKVCEKEVFHFRKLKVLKNCLFAKTYAPNFLKNQLQQNSTAQKTTVVSGYFFCFCIHVWIRSKSHQHRSCIFHQKFGIHVYSSNRCSIKLRGKIEKLESYQRFVETFLAVLLNFSAESPYLL